MSHTNWDTRFAEPGAPRNILIASEFRRVRKFATKRMAASSWLSVRPSAWTVWAPTGRLSGNFICDHLFFFEKSADKIRVSLQSDQNNDTSHQRCVTFQKSEDFTALLFRNEQHKMKARLYLMPYCQQQVWLRAIGGGGLRSLASSYRGFESLWGRAWVSILIALFVLR